MKEEINRRKNLGLADIITAGVILGGISVYGFYEKDFAQLMRGYLHVADPIHEEQGYSPREGQQTNYLSSQRTNEETKTLYNNTGTTKTWHK